MSFYYRFYEPDVETTELKLRSYQEELVQPALEGRNCVIVAPTGSGKTEVAIYAALHHIGEMISNRKAARVVLVVPTIALVAQQKERVLKYCRGKYHVDGFHGSEESKTGNGRRDDVLNSHVAVMTPQILVNMLQSVRQTERLYISDFSMIVLDEVHRASGNHPYVEISRLVQDWAHAKPQIIGLTASLNINATAHVDISRMLESIYEMLAILNTPYLSTITKQENIDELNRHVGKPDDSVEVCDPPSDVDAPLRGFIKRILHTYHTKLCNELDSLVKNRHNAFPTHYLKNFRNAKTDKFELYESFLQSVCQDLNKLNTADKGLAQLYTKYIRVYVEARGIVEVMPPTVALEYMKEALDKLNLNHTLSQFSDFSQNYEALTKNIDHKDPVIVIKLKNTIIEQFRVAPDSRVIIFVTQRSTAQRVCDFLNKSGIMDQFKMRNDGDSVGYVLGVNNSGAVQQSSQEQERVLDRFNNGKLKVLVATSVIEEGLDVTACNLIIKYNCSSGSAIQLIQQRGRARAKNSRSVLLAVSSAVNMKENNALISEKYMKACLTMIVKNTQKQLEIEVEKIKKRLEAERRRELEEQASMRLRHADKSYKVICASCNKHFCKSTAIKKIYSNYMVMEPEIWDHLDLVSRARKVNKMHAADCVSLCNIKCKHCKADIGRAYKIRGVYLPQLAVKELTFVPVHGNRMDTETKGKWKDVEEQLFFVPEAREADFKVMLNALVTSESNMEKKRLLDFDSKQHVKAIEIDAPCAVGLLGNRVETRR
uniref:RNA helicase n=1 Tax=Caenorhabditis japonica TaxID=281687 RepID=A0A8R1DIT3_CAEJA